MKLRDFMPIIACLLLQSCEYNKIDSDAIKMKSNEAALYNTKLGLTYLEQGDRARAKRKLLKALDQAPNSPEVHASMAWFMEQSGEINDAKSHYRQAMALAPGKGSQLNNYGAFLCRRGQYSEANTYFLKATKDTRYEQTASAYENAGLCAANSSDYKNAAQYFSKALERDPARKQSLYEWVMIDLKLGQKDKAIARLKKYKALTKSDPALMALASNLDVT